MDVDIAAHDARIARLEQQIASSTTLASFEGGNFGYQMVDSTHNARCRFLIPTRTVRVNKALLHFSLAPYRSGASSAAVAGTSGTSSANHTHAYSANTGTESADHTHGDPNHQHNLFTSGGTGTATGSNYTDGGGIVTQIWTVTGGTLKSYNGNGGSTGGKSGTHVHAAGGTTVGMSVDHTHTVPGGSISLPDSLWETGMAGGCHVFIDGTDVTSSIGGPWGDGVNPADIHDLDVSQWLMAKGWHEVQISSTQIGGIFPQLAIFAVVGV